MDLLTCPAPARISPSAPCAAVVDNLQQDPFAPHLAYHPLGGKLKGVQAVSITDSYRPTLTIVLSEKEIILLDIGSHDEVYR